MKLRILVVDDDTDICDLLKTALSSRGHAVTTLSDPTEFPFLMEETCPCSQNCPCADILIVDNVMPKIEGIEFFKQLKSRGCQTLLKGNVAIMSGYLTIHYMNELNDLGIHYFRKPFNLANMYEWVELCQSRIEGSLETSATSS
jgi:DNA-binding response OmpR family regulator